MQVYSLFSECTWHLGVFVSVALGIVITLAGAADPLRLTACVLYINIMTEAAVTACTACATLLENVGGVDKVIQCALQSLAEMTTEDGKEPTCVCTACGAGCHRTLHAYEEASLVLTLASLDLSTNSQHCAML
jgi:hypothetical protein